MGSAPSATDERVRFGAEPDDGRAGAHLLTELRIFDGAGGRGHDARRGLHDPQAQRISLSGAQCFLAAPRE